jgi:hypothetical protein
VTAVVIKRVAWMVRPVIQMSWRASMCQNHCSLVEDDEDDAGDAPKAAVDCGLLVSVLLAAASKV